MFKRTMILIYSMIFFISLVYCRKLDTLYSVTFPTNYYSKMINITNAIGYSVNHIYGNFSVRFFVQNVEDTVSKFQVILLDKSGYRNWVNNNAYDCLNEDQCHLNNDNPKSFEMEGFVVKPNFDTYYILVVKNSFRDATYWVQLSATELKKND